VWIGLGLASGAAGLLAVALASVGSQCDQERLERQQLTLSLSELQQQLQGADEARVALERELKEAREQRQAQLQENERQRSVNQAQWVETQQQLKTIEQLKTELEQLRAQGVEEPVNPSL
jgi:hypothetical protein